MSVLCCFSFVCRNVSLIGRRRRRRVRLVPRLLDLAARVRRARRLLVHRRLHAVQRRRLRPRVPAGLPGLRGRVPLRRLPAQHVQDGLRRRRLHALPAQRRAQPRQRDLRRQLRLRARLRRRRQRRLRRVPGGVLQQPPQRVAVLRVRGRSAQLDKGVRWQVSNSIRGSTYPSSQLRSASTASILRPSAYNVRQEFPNDNFRSCHRDTNCTLAISKCLAAARAREGESQVL